MAPMRNLNGLGTDRPSSKVEAVKRRVDSFRGKPGRGIILTTAVQTDYVHMYTVDTLTPKASVMSRYCAFARIRMKIATWSGTAMETAEERASITPLFWNYFRSRIHSR